MDVIILNKITKKYNNDKGVFDINIEINSGEVFGFIGPNGAGKTTTIRQIMGFIKPDKGSIKIKGIDVWNNSEKIMQDVGYLPGELIIPEYMKGEEYLKYCAAIRSNVEWSHVQELINFFELSPKIKIKKMSRGMKQKVAIIAAIMHKPKVLILDEPTTGLDPLMQEKLLNILQEFKKTGATILFSSHIFSEIEQLAQRVAFIKAGKIIYQGDVAGISNNNEVYAVKFIDNLQLQKFLKTKWNTSQDTNDKLVVKVVLEKNQINDFFKAVANFEISSCTKENSGLRESFLKLYEGEING